MLSWEVAGLSKRNLLVVDPKKNHPIRERLKYEVIIDVIFTF